MPERHRSRRTHSIAFLATSHSDAYLWLPTSRQPVLTLGHRTVSLCGSRNGEPGTLAPFTLKLLTSSSI